jgi:hypothetical protein
MADGVHLLRHRQHTPQNKTAKWGLNINIKKLRGINSYRTPTSAM